MNLKEIDKPEVKKTIVVYSGRFQPFHRGHNVAYQKLVSKFGANNVYIGTSDKTDGGKSPFNFSEKKTIMQKMFGIPSNKIVQLSNPYSPKEILSKFDGKTTAYIAAVGEKDATRLAGKYFKPYNGKTGYGYDEIGYTYIIPAEKNPISGTDVRNGLGNTDVEKSKSFFLKAYPKFDKDIFNMIKSKLNEEGLPGGIGVGLTLPNGYINGAPTGSTDELYDPINELLGRVAAEEIFNEWLENYLGEAPNPIMDKEITYNSADGKKKKITVRGALRLPKDHEAHIQAKKMVGPDDAPANEPKKKEVPNQPGQPVKKGDTAQGKADAKPKGDAAGAEKQAPPPEQKLSGAELKSSAEMTDADKHTEKVNQVLDKAKNNLPKEDKESIDKANSPQSPERKGAMNVLKKAASYVGHGIKHTFEHNRDMLLGTASAVKSLATTGRFGAVKDSEGRTKHWDDFTEPDPHTRKLDFQGKVQPKMKEVPVYKTDSHGHAIKDKDGNKIQAKTILGKPKTKKEPVYREDLTPEERELAEKSWKESQKQKSGLKTLAKTTGLIMGSIAVTGALIGGGGAVAAGAGPAAIAKAAGAKIAYKFGGGHLGSYILKDVIKHSAAEALGANALQASGVGIALGAAGIFENKNGEEEFDTKKFIPNFIEKTLEIMQNYKLSNEQLLQTIAQYKREGATNQSMSNAADLMKENISESKKKSIENFLEFATKRLKLQETPKVTLVSGREYGNVKSSLGGYNPEDKAIYVAIEGRLTADILRTIAHEMVHRKQDELGLIRNEVKDGADGSPIENQAHAVAGILMREYGRLNRQIYNEVSNVATANTADVPDGSFIKKGKKRKLDSDKSEVWYSNGGYTQTDFPKADTIFGDDDAEERTVKYTIKNLPNIEYVETEFFKEDIDVDVDTGDEVLMGKFKNKKVTVKDIGKDQHGMPTINGKQATTFRTVSEKLSQSNLNSVEKYADRELSPADIEFSNHFFDRVNDTRNGKEISEPELTGFFKRLSRHKKQFLDFLDKYNQIVVKDERSDINIPFVKMANKVIAKTIMRKGDFQTSSPTIVNEAQAVSGGKVHKFITGKNLGYKGKKYSQIEFETLSVDNKNGTIRFKILAPKEIFGNEISLDFRSVRRGPYFKTDTSKVNEVVARYIEPKRVEAFLKKYPKVGDLMQKIVDKVKDVDRGYQIFLHYKEDKGQERYFGGKKDEKSKSTNVKGVGRTALNKTGKSFNSKTSYKYEWDGKLDYPTWGEVFQYVWNKKYQSINESTSPSDIIKDLDKVRNDLIKKVDVLIAKKKKLYSNVDIESPMSADEKQLDKDIQSIFSQIQQLILQKRSLKKESINELTNNEKRIKDGNPSNVYYAFYKGKFEAVYWAMNPSDLFNIYWDEFKVRRPAGSKFKLNPEFIIVPKKEYDKNPNQYSKLKPYVDKFWDKLQSESVNESLLLEGGAYGHMNHPFDISMNLTFGDLKKIINNALDGKLGVVREKTDGQALAISWKNGRLIAARNKGHLANGGASALDINALASKFGGRGALSDAYNFAMRDLSAAISGLGEKERQSIFKDGSAFCNLEVIYPENANVIPYGQSLLIFHNVVEYDEKGNAVGAVKGAESKLASLIKQTNAHVQSKYTLQGPPITKLPKDEKLSSQKSKFNSMLSRLQSEFGLSDKDGVADYHYAWWMNFVNKSKKNLAELEKEGLARRWAFDNKSFGIKSIADEDARKWADGVDKDAKDKIMKGNLRKFEDIFLGVGAEVLSFMSSVLTAQPDKALQSIKTSLESSISDIRNGGSEAQIRRLEKELARLNAIGGFEKLVPNEGLVFFYKGNTYKLTGTFAPLNQILGIFKFGR